MTGEGELHSVVDSLEWKRWLVGDVSRDLSSVVQYESALVTSLRPLKLQLLTFLRIYMASRGSAAAIFFGLAGN